MTKLPEEIEKLRDKLVSDLAYKEMYRQYGPEKAEQHFKAYVYRPFIEDHKAILSLTAHSFNVCAEIFLKRQCPCGRCHCPTCGNQIDRDKLQSQLQLAIEAINTIDKLLTKPATTPWAEYAPAIRDVFEVIDTFRAAKLKEQE